MTPFDAAFYARSPLDVAPALLGAWLVHETDEGRLVGRIVETEAYTDDDPAMHGWKAIFGDDGRVQPVGRAAALFGPPGTAYVYKIYAKYWLLNVVCEPEGTAGAVLIRAVEPVEGVGAMRERRPAARREVDVTNGPGKLTEAFDLAEAPATLRSRFHGTDLTSPPLYVVPGDSPVGHVQTTSRIGISRGIDLPYRFVVAGHPYVSPGVPSDERVARRTGRSTDSE